MTLGIGWTMEALTWGERSRHFCLYVVNVWVYEVFERTSWFGGVLKVTEVTSSSLFIFLLFWQNKSCLLSPARFLAFRNDFQPVDFSNTFPQNPINFKPNFLKMPLKPSKHLCLPIKYHFEKSESLKNLGLIESKSLHWVNNWSRDATPASDRLTPKSRKVG